MLPSTAPILHLKEVPAQASVPQRKSGAADFFQYFTQGPSRAWVGMEARHIPHEVTEILKEEIYPHSANGLRPHFLQADGVKPLKEAPGAPGNDNVTLTRPRDPGPGARAALTRQPCRPGLSLEEEVVMDRSPHIAPAPLTAAGTLDRCILALDLGTSTGWALRSAEGLITSGTASFRPGRYDGGGMRYLRFTNWLTEIDRLSGPDRRDLVRGGAPPRRNRCGPCLWRAHGHADRMGGTARRALCRRSRRHDQASRHRQGQRAEGGDDRGRRARGFSPADDNEADAIALLLWAIETNGGVA
jgi:hypothetical protein